MENTDTGIETQSGGSQPGFGFQNCIKIVEYGIRRIDR